MLFLGKCGIRFLCLIFVVGTTASSFAENPNLVIAQLNLWYYGSGKYGGFESYDGSGKPIVKLTPKLGKYFSNDPNVVRQQIEWAANFGVDAFSIEWTTPRGTPTSIEENLDDAFLKAPNLCKIRWCLFYDFVLRLLNANLDFQHGIDFNNKAIYKMFVADFVRFGTKYFGQQQYLKIDGRPVIYIWGSWSFKGNFQGAVKEARTRLRKMGYDVYIAADVVRSDSFDPLHASVFDADTSFVPFLVPGAPPFANLGASLKYIENYSTWWKSNIAGMKVRGRMDPVSFQSSWTPQFDNRLYIKNNDDPNRVIYIPALNKNQVMESARLALRHTDAVGSNKQKIVWIGTFNNWAETTTLEPTAVKGPKYPAGNYQMDMLNIVKTVFGPQTFNTENPCTP